VDEIDGYLKNPIEKKNYYKKTTPIHQANNGIFWQPGCFIQPACCWNAFGLGQGQKINLPKGTRMDTLVGKNPANLDTRNLDLTPVEESENPL
jgi:hypothetical protein